MKLLASAVVPGGPLFVAYPASPSARRSRSKRSSKMYKAWPRRHRSPSRRPAAAAVPRSGASCRLLVPTNLWPLAWPLRT